MSQTVNKRKTGKTNVFYDARNLYDYVLKITANENVFRPDLKEMRKEISNSNDLKAEAENVINIMSQLESDEDKCKFLFMYLAQQKEIALNQQGVENEYVSIINDLRQSAKDIFIYAWQANNVLVNQSKEAWNIRESYELKALASCASLLAFISLAQRKVHLRSKRVEYWNGLVKNVQSQLYNLHSSEKIKYKELG